MPPQSSHVPISSLEIKFPNRNTSQSSTLWLKNKQVVDGAEGYWRIHDNLYDFTPFITQHPGGSEWLELSKGTDITEAFEAHHITNVAEGLLQKYFVKKAKTARSSPFTFKPDGFYRTLKNEIRPVLKNLPKTQQINTSAVFTDALLTGMFIFGILAVQYWNYKLAILSGLFLGGVTIAAHNYFHQRDNLRMLYFNFSLMQTTEWRVSHVLSHHLHTNTIADMEISLVEPVLNYLPFGKDTTAKKYQSWLFFPFVCIFSFHGSFIRRILEIIKGDHSLIKWYDFIPFLLPAAMYIFGGQSFFATLWMWTVIIMVGSLHFGMVGFNAAHHHPDIFHDGDATRLSSDKTVDWGLHQLDAVMDRTEITGSHFLVLTNFGDHALHHMFPTLDHGRLEYLYPVFDKVCEQFNVKLRMKSQLDLIKGNFLQLTRGTPNPNPPK